MQKECEEKIMTLTKGNSSASPITIAAALAATFSHEKNLKLAVYSAELVLVIFEGKYPHDDRPRKAIEAAKKCLESDTKENRLAAADARTDAAIAASCAAVAAVDTADDDTASYAAIAASCDTFAATAASCAADAATADAADTASFAASFAADAEITQKIIAYATRLSEEI